MGEQLSSCSTHAAIYFFFVDTVKFINFIILILFSFALFVWGYIESVKAVNPFIDRIPSHEHDEFFEDYVDWVAKLGLILDDPQNDEKMCRIIVPYKLLVAYARK